MSASMEASDDNDASIPHAHESSLPSTNVRTVLSAFKESSVLSRENSAGGDAGVDATVTYASMRWKPRPSDATWSFRVLYLVLFSSLLCSIVVGPFVLPLLFWPYVGWVLFIDRNTPERSGRPIQWMKNLNLWKSIASYFPVKLHREGEEFDKAQKYIFCYHPHGVISFGAFLSFATNALDFPALFPGINLRLLTLAFNFKLPFTRELLLSLGICSVSKTSIVNHLATGPGAAVCIVTGGAAESLQAKPGTYQLTLKHRKGFAKVALQTGACLVPVFGFGENDVFDISKASSFVESVQKTIKRYLSFTVPLFHGTGITGLLPYQEPIFVVVGEPIKPRAPRDPKNITQEEIDDLHAAYMRALIDLYNRWKRSVSFNRVESLRVE